MKLLFVISDVNGRHIEYQATGIMSKPSLRCVEIELTSDQLSKIALKKIGINCGVEVYESIQEVAILTE
jgi:hypothetical protein